MKRNQLGTSDIYISELTLGCMSIGKDMQKAKQIIEYALDSGINHLDTADLYEFGLNEELIGEILKGKRNEVVLTTKAGNHFNKKTKEWFWDPSKKYIKEAVKMSLKRLQTDYIDFYMLHGGTIDDPIDDTIEAFEELKKDGLIRAYGISSIRPNVIREYVNKANIDGVMTQYSLLDRRPEEEILPLLAENKISVLARGPMARGLLSSDFANQLKLKGSDGYLDYGAEELKQTVEKIAALTKDSLSMNTIALRFVHKHPAISTTVFGASSQEQVKKNIDSFQAGTLSDSLYEKLQQFTKSSLYTNHR